MSDVDQATLLTRQGVFDGHLGTAPVTVLRHVQRDMVVPQPHVVPPLVLGHDGAVEAAGIGREPYAARTCSCIPALSCRVARPTVIDVALLPLHAVFPGSHTR